MGTVAILAQAIFKGGKGEHSMTAVAEDPAIMAARAKLAAKMANSQTGGKGSARRKTKKSTKATGQDDKRLANTLKRIGMNAVPGIEEVNMFKADGEVIHFANPKVQANIAANTYVINGNAEAKKLIDMLPGIITQLGPDNLNQLKHIAQSLGSQAKGPGGDDYVPDVDANFDEVE